MAKKNKIVIPCRMAYVNCWEPNSRFGAEKYSLVAIIKKSDVETIQSIQKVIDYVTEKSITKWGGRIPATLKNPLHDGDQDKPVHPVFQNCYYLNARRKDAPQIVDHNVQPIIDQSELYSGCYGNISLIFYGYNFGGNKGIAVLEDA